MQILKQENEFLKLEMQKIKQDLDKSRSIIEYEKFKNEKAINELLKSVET